LIRILLTYVLPILLPTVVYLLWLSASGRAGKKGTVPWAWLLGAGVFLTALVLVGTTIMGAGETSERYIPPHVDETGRVVPGRFE